jgi:hypothetical protein
MTQMILFRIYVDGILDSTAFGEDVAVDSYILHPNAPHNIATISHHQNSPYSRAGRTRNTSSKKQLTTMNRINARPEQHMSPFFKLPGELRNIIYDLVLEPWKESTQEPHEIPPITQVCHEIRLETYPLFLRRSSFSLWCALKPESASRLLETWIHDVIGVANAHHVRDLTFALDVPWWSLESWKVHLNLESWPVVNAEVGLYSPLQCALIDTTISKIVREFADNAERLEGDVVRVVTDDVGGLVDLMQEGGRWRFVDIVDDGD